MLELRPVGNSLAREATAGDACSRNLRLY